MFRVLIDNSVLNHAVTIKGRWQSNGTSMWGHIPINTGQLVSRIEPIKIRESKGGDQILYIAALAKAFEKNSIHAVTTDVMKFERMHQPAGRFTGTNYGDMSLFRNVHCSSIQTLEGFSFSMPVDRPIEELRAHLLRSNMEPFVEIHNSLRANLDEINQMKMSQDAWHLHSALAHNLNAFLVTDTALIGQIKSLPKCNLRDTLLDIVYLPSELCEKLKVPACTIEDIETFIKEYGSFPLAKDMLN